VTRLPEKRTRERPSERGGRGVDIQKNNSEVRRGKHSEWESRKGKGPTKRRVARRVLEEGIDTASVPLRQRRILTGQKRSGSKNMQKKKKQGTSSLRTHKGEKRYIYRSRNGGCGWRCCKILPPIK